MQIASESFPVPMGINKTAGTRARGCTNLYIKPGIPILLRSTSGSAISTRPNSTRRTHVSFPVAPPQVEESHLRLQGLPAFRFTKQALHHSDDVTFHFHLDRLLDSARKPPCICRIPGQYSPALNTSGKASATCLGS